jgi:hypothetical protein
VTGAIKVSAAEPNDAIGARRRRATPLLAGVSALLALVVITAGCGGDDNGPDGAGPATEQPAPAPTAGGEDGQTAAAADPCELLDQQQVSSRLPGPATPEPDFGWSGGQCRWEADSEGEPRIIVGLAPWGEFGELTEGANVSPEPLDGLGDEAVLLDGTVAPGTFSADGRTLYVRRGTEGIGIVWDRAPASPPTEQEMRELAEDVLGAL